MRKGDHGHNEALANGNAGHGPGPLGGAAGRHSTGVEMETCGFCGQVVKKLAVGPCGNLMCLDCLRLAVFGRSWGLDAALSSWTESIKGIPPTVLLKQ